MQTAAPVDVELPANLGDRLPHEESTYTLRARVEVPAAWRGQPLDLVVPAFDGLIHANADGAIATSSGLELPRGYRQPGPHRFTIPATASEDGAVDLELVIDHRWTGSAAFAAAPRLLLAGHVDQVTWLIWAFNLVTAVASLVALFQIGITSAMVYFTDRKRTAYLLFGAQALTAQIYPLHVLGLTQLVFGRGDVVLLGALLLAAMCGSVYFTHAFFGLPPPKRWFGIGTLVLAAAFTLAFGSFDTGLYVGRPAVVYLGIVAGYQVITCVRVYLRGYDRRGARYLLLSWIALASACVPDLIAWSWLGDPLHGMRVANVGLALFALWLSLLFSQRHILAMSESDHKGRELAERVAELERNRTEIEQLNEELRHQLSEKSSQIYAALTLPTDQPLGKPEIKIGDTIEGRYRVERLLGSGGMGDVYEVVRLLDDKRLALKLAHEVSGVALARLAREALVALTVTHDNVVKVVDVDVASAGFLYIVMELVDGAQLRDHLKDPKHDLAWTLGVLRQLARGLAALHGAGIVHRDLKPANVLVSEVGEAVHVKITDFGISLGRDLRAAAGDTDAPDLELTNVPGCDPGTHGDGESDATVRMPLRPLTAVRERIRRTSEHGALTYASLTRTGLLPGTPAYIAPELARGRAQISPAIDVYAFGVIAYELLTGQRPFKEPPVLAMLSGHRPGWPAPLAETHPDLPPSLCALVDQCIAQKRDARPTSAEIVEQLDALGSRSSRVAMRTRQ